MIDEVDLCIWGKNGARYLPVVLKRVDEVIPEKNVSKKIFVDDSSRDATVEIARSFGWTVYKNIEGFVSGGAREALRHVESEFFVSVEQDLLLAEDWWQKIPRHMADPLCICAQGTQLNTLPVLTHIETARQEFDQMIHMAPSRLQSGRPRVRSAILGGRSLDNNLWRTNALRGLGGFPNTSRVFVDEELFKIICQTDYKWLVDETVVCPHIRESVLGVGRHSFNITTLTKRRRQSSPLTWFARWAGETLWSPRVCLYDPRAFPPYLLLQAYTLKALAIKWLRDL